MSIISLLAKQNLILRKNNLQYALLKNSAARRNMLNNISFGGVSCFENAYNYEKALDLNSIFASSELMAINAELSAINSYCDKSLNYLA